MSATQITLLFIGLLAVAALVLAGVYQYRRQALRKRFGPEYDRLVSEQDSPRAAEHELRERERRHAGLRLRQLPPDAKQWYSEQWQDIQARFIEDPKSAVGAADELVTRLVAEIGYPVRDYHEQVNLLSVEHARTIGEYREAHDIAERHRRGETDTEDLRQALVHYRSLFTELLGEQPVPKGEPVRRGRHGA